MWKGYFFLLAGLLRDARLIDWMKLGFGVGGASCAAGNQGETFGV